MPKEFPLSIEMLFKTESGDQHKVKVVAETEEDIHLKYMQIERESEINC